MANDKIVIEQEVKGDLSELQDAKRHFRSLGDSLDKLEKEQAELARSTDKTARALSNMSSSARGLAGGLGRIARLGVAGIFGGIALAIGKAVGAASEWNDGIAQMNSQLGISAERASVLATAWATTGSTIEEGTQALGGLGRRITGELRAQEEASKTIANLGRERVKIEKDIAKAETEHFKNLAELEAERASINESGINERLAERDAELSELQGNYQKTIEGLRRQEERESQKFSEIWDARLEDYRKRFLDARETFEEKSANARNFREFQKAREQFEKTQKELSDNLGDEQSKHKTAHEQRIDDLRRSREEESVLFAERSAEIAAAADKDVAKLQEANAQALIDLDARIEAEKAAYAESVIANNERIASIAEAQSEAADSGGQLLFMLKKLGVELTDSEGNLKDLDTLYFDIARGISEMDDKAQAAVIANALGMGDLAQNLMSGISQQDAYNEAVKRGTLVTQDTVDANAAYTKANAELEGALIGAANAFFKGVGGYESAAEAISGLADSLTLLVDSGFFERLGEGVALMAGAVGDAVEMFMNLWDIISEVFDLASKKVDEDGILGMLMNATTAAGVVGGSILDALIPSFENEGIVPGSGPQLIQAHGGEVVARPETIAGLRGGGSNAVFNFNAPIYGVNDLQAAISESLSKVETTRTNMGVA